MGKNSISETIKVGEGKTKSINEYVKTPGVVKIISKPVLTKGNGKTIVHLPGKDIWANQTTCRVFNYLRKNGIPLAYRNESSDISFDADKADMIKIELVVRNRPYGSRLKRHPEEQGIKTYENPVVELFFKNDEEDDPFLIYDIISNHWLLYNAGMPLKEGFIRELPFIKTSAGRIVDMTTIQEMIGIARKVNKLLLKALKKLNIFLVDIKLEFGFVVRNGKVYLVLGDVVDNDSWRIWPDGDESQMKDKQVFRMISKIKSEDLEKIAENYKWVAEKVGQF